MSVQAGSAVFKNTMHLPFVTQETRVAFRTRFSFKKITMNVEGLLFKKAADFTNEIAAHKYTAHQFAVLYYVECHLYFLSPLFIPSRPSGAIPSNQ